MQAGVPSSCCMPQICYKSRNNYGFRCQSVLEYEYECEDEDDTLSLLLLLVLVLVLVLGRRSILPLTPDTRNLLVLRSL